MLLLAAPLPVPCLWTAERDSELDVQAVCCLAASEAAAIDAKVRERLLKLARKQGATNHGEAIQLVETWIAEMAGLIDPESAYRAPPPLLA